MLEVTVSFDPAANRRDQLVRLNNHNKLTPKSAVAARNIAAGIGANAWVTDGTTTYRVVKNRARKC
jgi:hypothetical protein